MFKTPRIAQWPLRLAVEWLLTSSLLLSLLASPLLSQTFYGTLIGTVTDASGAVVPGVTVTLIKTDTSERRTGTTEANGSYRFVNLVPGSYRLEVELTGFKRYVREPIIIEVQSTVRIDVPMQLGAISETVEVSTETPLLQTESTALGQVVDARKVQEMPLNGRNVLNLASLVPGVIPGGYSMQNAAGTNVNAFGNYQINGGFGNSSAGFLDGAPLNTPYANQTALVPTQDAIQEFRVQTNNLSAEFGRFAGGVINLTTKSGSNSFHGGAYEFFRNTVLNANNFFNNASGVKTPPYNQNQYGANIGGPIKKDKTFFFFSWEGYRQRQALAFLNSVPTAAMRAGDFSASGLPKIYDPLTTCGRLGNPACAKDSTGKEIITRQQFANNKIPDNRVDPVARAMRGYWADQNLPGNVNNYATNYSWGGDNDQYNWRIDHYLSDKQRLFGRYTRWTDHNLGQDPMGKGVHYNADKEPEYFTTQQIVLGDTYTFNPTTVGDFRLGYLRFTFKRVVDMNVDYTKFGLPDYVNKQATFHFAPTIGVQNFFSLSGGVPIGAATDNGSLSGSLTKLWGRHTLKFGGEGRRMTFNFWQSNNGNTNFSFDNLFTSTNPTAPAGTGYGMASFLLGYGSTGSIQTLQPVADRMMYYGFYVTDTFQMTKKLTLNYGVRWELPFAYSERYDRLSVLNPDAVNPFGAAAGMPNLKGKLTLVNTSEYDHRTDVTPHYRLLAPRVGFAYRMTDKTVFRGGYGIFYMPVDVVFTLWNTGITLLTTSWVPSNDGSLTPQDKVSDPWPTGIPQPPARDKSMQQVMLGQNVNGAIPDQKWGYIQQWNLNLQREFGQGFLVEVAWAGSKGTRILQAQQLNQIPDQYMSLGASQLNKQVANPFYGIVPAGTLSKPTVAYGQLLRPFPQYTGVSASAQPVYSSIYHSGQLKVEKRFRTGAALLAAYSFSKLLSDTDAPQSWLEQLTGGVASYQNNNNYRGERSVVSQDVPHRLVVSYVLDLPFGKGKKYLNSTTGFVGKLVSGWGVNGVSTFQSGYPLKLSMNTSLNGFGEGQRPNFVAGCDLVTSGSAQSRIGKWFNTACFSSPGSFAYGNVPRTVTQVRAAGSNNWDFAVFKRTMFTEQVGLEFRTEIFNLFNRVQFGFPGQAFGSPTFGVVASQGNNPRLIQFALRMVF